MRRMLLNLSFLTVIAAGINGCQTKAQSGALIGAGAGAGAGAIIGHQSGHAGRGALIGGAVGAIGGGLIGNEMDKSDERKERERDREWRLREAEARRGYDRYDTDGQRLTKGDIINWTARGTRDDIIIERIRRSGTVFYLTREEERDLRDEGVSPQVIRAMKDTARR